MKALRIAAIICLILMVLPLGAIPFTCADLSQENRDPAPFPSLRENALSGDFAGQFESFLCDRLGLRNMMVRLNALLNLRLFHVSTNDDVIPGKDGWLYYGPTLADYTGEGRLSDDELERIRENLSLLTRSLESRGTHLHVAIVPNKSTVYPQYMPARYTMRQDGGNIPLVKTLCDELRIPFIDLTAALTEAAGTRQVYYLTDTHWNELGAYLAADEILSAMGRALSVERSVTGTSSFKDGDLARLMGLPGSLADPSPVLSQEDSLPGQDFGEHLVRCAGSGEGTLLVMRDSFGTEIAPYLADAYEESVFRWEAPLRADEFCDDALLLIAERNIRLYLADRPVCWAPWEDVTSGGAVPDELALTVWADGANVHFLTESVSSAAYILVNGEACAAAPAEDGMEAILPLDELSPEDEISVLLTDGADKRISACRTLEDLLGEWPEDSEDDYEMLMRMREEMEAEEDAL